MPTDAIPNGCPTCREDRLIEFDTALRCYVCGVCSRQWRRRGRLVPTLNRQRPLLALDPTVSELPPASTRRTPPRWKKAPR